MFFLKLFNDQITELICLLILLAVSNLAQLENFLVANLFKKPMKT